MLQLLSRGYVAERQQQAVLYAGFTLSGMPATKVYSPMNPHWMM